ncbi:5'-nucleotidase C-terminal domain-containing protein [Pseudoflavonifractor hominis]|uniref:5'-nucleotidase C-terminal domain-containing protein n=1 Tax=Pseudoflavonifractor hominis TaxID=2763059 RepID=A0ABR7HSP3_9FIRM|nr:5'-nucleotidase C-terminal domain-containing protein [Pseudoflavonifractor hominis]MBC5730539.1 5'-nucleotidase C-terminal domain-containing protein [Pseudoflavonifractor hominis]
MKGTSRTARRLTACVLTGALAAGFAAVPALAAEPASLEIGIYSTTDMHGKCYDLNPIDGKEVKNSYLKVATAMEKERAAMDGTILIDNGDIIQGSSIISYNMNMEGGKDNPMAICLRYIGYDAFVPGNHEFNFDMETQQIFYDMLSDTSSKYPGKPVDALCANYINVATQEPNLTPYKVMTFDVGGSEFKVGILGFENVNVPNWDLPTHYEGSDFVHKDNTERTYAYEWVNYWQKELREKEDCDFVIVASHSGEDSGLVGAGDGDAVETGKTDFSPENQVRHLVENTTGIDMVIAGHNHKVGVTEMKNADGQTVPCVNGGTSTLTKTPVTIRSDGTFTIGESENLDLTTYENDAGLKALMQPYYDRTLPFITEQIGTLSGDWDDETDLFHVQSDTMNLVHEAQLWATGADLSLASPVANKDFCIGQLLDGKDSAPISLKDCYSFYKYDNNLIYMIQMTGKQIKDWLEDCTKDFTVEAGGTITGGGFGTDQLYGMDYDIYMGNPEGSRVVNLTYQGKPVTDDQTFKVALNSYRLSANAAGDEFGWYATTGITMGTDAVLWDGSVSEEFGSIGGSVTLVIAEYIKAMTAEGKDITPPEAKSHWTLNAGTSPAADTVTRLQFAESLYQAMTADAETLAAPADEPFTDIADNTAILWLSGQKVISGDGTGKFNPNAPITREQAAVMLMNAAAALDKGPQGAWAVQIPYADASSISPWASEGVMWNVIQKYLPVGEDNQFAPQGTLTQADADAAIAALMAQK